MATNGILKFQGTNKATFVGATSNVVIDTVKSSLGIGVDVDGPTSNLHVVGNAYVSTELTVTGNVAVDTDTLFVDTVNDRVGIGTTTPGSTLDVNGSLRAAYDQDVTSYIGKSALGGITYGATFAHKDMNTQYRYALRQTYLGQTIINAKGNQSISFRLGDIEKAKITSDGDFIVDTNTLVVKAFGNKVGVGKTDPATALDVVGTVTATAFTGPLTGAVTGNASTATKLAGTVNIGGVAFDGSAAIVPTTFTAATFSGDVTVDSTTFHVDSTNNRVGIGTTSPTQSLHVSKVTSGGVTSILVSNPDGALNTSAALKLGVSVEDNTVAKFGIIHERKSTYGGGDTYFCTNYATDTTEVSESDVAMTILGSNKNVGIGTTSPATKLHLAGVGTGSGPRLRFETLNNGNGNYTVSGTEIGGIQFGADDYGWTTQHVSSEIVGIHDTPNYSGAMGILAFKTSTTQGSNPTEKMRIDASGNVGIGNTTPAFPLTIGADDGNKILFNESTTPGHNITCSSGWQWNFNAARSGQDDDAKITFNISGSSGYDEMMRVNHTGVGIGKTNPACTLDVYGTSTTTGISSTRLWLTAIGDNSGDGSPDDNTGSPWYGLGFHDLAWNDQSYKYSGNIPILSGYSGVALRSGSGNLVLTTAGKVGIGTTSPTQKLHVEGDIHCKSGTSYVQISGGGSIWRNYGPNSGGAGLHFTTNALIPADLNGGNHGGNTITLGAASYKWAQIYSTSSTISTSDRNQKQDINDITESERKVASKITDLFKTFRIKDAVSKKGDDARLHNGVIAQDLIEAFKSEGLEAHRYGLFCYDEKWTVDDEHELMETVYEKDGISEYTNEDGDVVKYTVNDEGVETVKIGLGVFADKNTPGAVFHSGFYSIRYEELLCFVVAGELQNERLKYTALEARILALENA
jgi:hypothetical protein